MDEITVNDYPEGPEILPMALGEGIAKTAQKHYVGKDEIQMPKDVFYALIKHAAMNGHVNGLKDAVSKIEKG